MEGKYYIGLQHYIKECIEIEPTIKDCFLFNVPSWNMDITKQDLINIRDKINEILEDDNEI
ncbi:hypothetical protein M2263_002361 [Providencia alcalifaciens]|nr:hypothetical protein [Providencia alcalifaciens]